MNKIRNWVYMDVDTPTLLHYKVTSHYGNQLQYQENAPHSTSLNVALHYKTD